MTCSILTNNQSKFVNKGYKLIFILFFFIATLFVTSAQDTSTTVRANHIDYPSTASKPLIQYIHFKSDSLFYRALKNTSFESTYSIVSILDTLAGIPRKRTGIVQANKLILPLQYDSIQHTSADEFITRTSFFSRRKYVPIYAIYQATTKYTTTFKAKHIRHIAGSIYEVRADHASFLYNSSTKIHSPTYDRLKKIDSIFIQLTTSDESVLLHTSAANFITSPYKTLIKTSDSVYHAVLYIKWDIYKNTGEKIISDLGCDSIKPSVRFSRWNLFRNGNSYYRWDLSLGDSSERPINYTKNFSAALNISTFKYDTLKQMLQFDSVFYQSDNWLMYKKAGSYGYCDTIGNVKIAHQYDTITAWHDGMAAIRFKKKWGYINKREQMTVQPYYTLALPFINGAAEVFDGKKWMFVSKEGKNINSVSYDSIQKTSSGKWYVFNKGLYGLCDSNGRELIPPSYEYLLDGNSDVFVFKKDMLYGLIEKDRTIRCKPSYDQFIYDQKNNCYLLKQLSQSSLLFILPSK